LKGVEEMGERRGKRIKSNFSQDNREEENQNMTL
jgi:hypothetical protein